MYRELSVLLLSVVLGCGNSPSTPQPPRCRANGQECGVSNDCCNPALCVNYRCQSSVVGSQSGNLLINYTSPYGTGTTGIELMGMFEPSGPWMDLLCLPVYNSPSITCSLQVPVGASSLVINARISSGTTVRYSCDETPCGSGYSQNGNYSIINRGVRLSAAAIANGFSCGCNHRFSL